MSKFCASCGIQLSEDAAFCASCGTAQTTDYQAPGQIQPAVNNQERYAFHDFISMDPDYLREKDSLMRNFKTKISIAYFCLGLSGILEMVSIFTIFTNPPAGFIMFMIFIFCIAGSGVIAAVLTSKRQKELEKLGEVHYSNYVRRFNGQ